MNRPRMCRRFCFALVSLTIAVSFSWRISSEFLPVDSSVGRVSFVICFFLFFRREISRSFPMTFTDFVVVDVARSGDPIWVSLGFTRLNRVSLGFSSGFTGLDRLRLAFTGFHRVLLGFYWIPLGFTKFNRAQSNFTGFYRVSLG